LISELELDCAFANKLKSSKDFCIWVLSQTKFSDRSRKAILLDNEQAQAKPRKKPENWWRHWWCKLEDGTESETDIFVVFALSGSSRRFALHIEDKPPRGKFTPNQYLNYRRRAEFMAGKSEYMCYSDFTTILLAPEAFIREHCDKAHHFDCRISYESVAMAIPLFGQSLAEARRPKLSGHGTGPLNI
jgi:hypothetical protein